jgi:hypothetical protein
MITHVDCEGDQEPRFEASGEALLLINDCLNEVLHGFPTPALDLVLGVPIEQAEELLKRVNRVARVAAGPLSLGFADLALVAKCIRLTESELGPEFPIRTGFQNEVAQSLEVEIARLIAGVGNRRHP